MRLSIQFTTGPVRVLILGLLIFLLNSCYSFYVVARETCATELECHGECFTHRYAFVASRADDSPAIWMDPGMGGFRAGLGIGGPCYLPFVPYPKYDSKELYLEVRVNSPRNDLQSVEFVNPYISDSDGSDRTEFPTFRAERPDSEKKDSATYDPQPDSRFMRAEGEIIGFESIIMNYEDGSRDIIENPVIHMGTHYALYLVYYNDIFTFDGANTEKTVLGGCPIL